MSRSGLGPILLHILCVSLPFPCGVMLVSHLHPVVQFGMSRTVRLLLWAFVACAGTALFLLLYRYCSKEDTVQCCQCFIGIWAVYFTDLLVITIQDTRCFPKHCNRHSVPHTEHWSADPTGCLNPWHFKANVLCNSNVRYTTVSLSSMIKWHP